MKRAIYTTTYFFILLGISILFAGCCGLVGKYELFLIGEPTLDSANIYLDGRLIETAVSGHKSLCMPYGKHEIKVVQKGFKPFVDSLDTKRGDRSEQSLLVEFEPLDSLPAGAPQSDTAK